MTTSAARKDESRSASTSSIEVGEMKEETFERAFTRSGFVTELAWTEQVIDGQLIREARGVLCQDVGLQARQEVASRAWQKHKIVWLSNAALVARTRVCADGRLELLWLGVEVVTDDDRRVHAPFAASVGWDEALQQIATGHRQYVVRTLVGIMCRLNDQDTASPAYSRSCMRKLYVLAFSTLVGGVVLLVWVWSAVAWLLQLNVVAAHISKLATALYLLGLCGFVGLLCFFFQVDVYHQYYDGTGSNLLYIGYNLARVCFAGYLAWMLYFAGRQVLALLHRQGADEDCRLDRFIKCFVVGAASVTVLLFVVGYLNLYYRWTAAGLALALLIPSHDAFQKVVIQLRAAILEKYQTTSLCQRAGYALPGCSFLVISIILLAAKGIYPSGYGDYFNHYFPYYMHVLDSHGLQPNDVWYQYYYSKGAGLTFFTILLTDYEGPPLVTYLFVLVSALSLYSILRTVLRVPFVPLTAATIYLAAFIFTPSGIHLASQLAFLDDRFLTSPDLRGFLSSACWGYFQKQHVITAAMLILVFWTTWKFETVNSDLRRSWLTATALGTVGLIVMAPTSCSLLLPFFSVMLLVAMLRRKGKSATGFLALNGVTGATLALIVAANYLLTGMFEMTPIRVWWKLADQQRVSNWLSPYEMLALLEGSDANLGSWRFPYLYGLDIPMFWNVLMRLHVFRFWFVHKFVFFAVCTGVAALLLFRVRRTGTIQTLLIPVSVFAVSALTISLIVSQPISLFRSYDFFIYFVVLAGALLWVSLIEGLVYSSMAVPLANFAARIMQAQPLNLLTAIGRNARSSPSTTIPASGLGTLLCFILCSTVSALAVIHTLEMTPRYLQADWVDFATGRMSIAQAYAKQDGLDSGLVAVAQVVGPRQRVWNFNSHLTCVFPDFWLETMISFRLGNRWHEIMFSPPEHAKSILQSQQRNYFFVNLDEPLNDFFPCSPLFHPDHIQDHLALAWSDSSSKCLLTWPGKNTIPLSDAFVRRYRAKVNETLSWNRQGIFAKLHQIYEDNKGRGYPLAIDPKLPILKGFQ